MGKGALLLTADEAAATRLTEDLTRLFGEEKALLFPEREFTYPVSYTHLDVYKRQLLVRLDLGQCGTALLYGAGNDHLTNSLDAVALEAVSYTNLR